MPTTRKIHFTFFRSKKNRQFYFRIVSSTGKTLAQSEGYKNEKDAQKSADRIKAAFGAEAVKAQSSAVRDANVDLNPPGLPSSRQVEQPIVPPGQGRAARVAAPAPGTVPVERPQPEVEIPRTAARGSNQHPSVDQPPVGPMTTSSVVLTRGENLTAAMARSLEAQREPAVPVEEPKA